MSKPESNFIFGFYRSKLRYRSISEWSKTLSVSTNAINNHLEQEKDMQSFIDRHHCEATWELWNRWVFA